jgi:hypothetical protein
MAFEQVTPSGPMTLSANRTPDPISWLPEGAADRLRTLRDRCADLNRLIPTAETRLAAGAARVEAERRVARLLGHHSGADGGFELKPGDPGVIQAEKELEELTAAKMRVEQRHETRAAAYRSASGVLSACEAFLRNGPGPLADYKGEEPKLGKGETVLDAIERLRRRGRELRASLHAIRSAPHPSTHARAQMRQQIAELAARGRPSVSGSARAGS